MYNSIFREKTTEENTESAILMVLLSLPTVIERKAIRYNGMGWDGNKYKIGIYNNDVLIGTILISAGLTNRKTIADKITRSARGALLQNFLPF